MARKHGTDKGGNHLKAGNTCHQYTPTYYELFKDRIHDVRAVLEIGVLYGQSLRMWREFFPNAEIIGIDNNKGCLFKEPQIRCFHADQGNAHSLSAAIAGLNLPPYDLIIDDGSHDEGHQVVAAQTLLPHLAKDGFYVIEDLQYDCKPERVGNRIGGPWTWTAMAVGYGIGHAHCECGCMTQEQLLVLRWP